MTRATLTALSERHDAAGLLRPETLLAGAAQALVVTDAEGRIDRANERASAMLELSGRGASLRIQDLVVPRERARIASAIRQSVESSAAEHDVEATVLHANGAGGLVLLTFLPYMEPDGPRVLIMLRDLTLDRQARDAASMVELAEHRAEAANLRKLADLGRITSGIVHEVKTPLTYVSNNLVLARQSLEAMREQHPALADEVNEVLEMLDGAQQGSTRLARLLLGLRPLSQNRVVQRVRTDLMEVVMDAARTFRGSHGGTTRIDVDLQSAAHVVVDRDEIVQVLLNLLTNAANALGDRGVVTIQLRDNGGPEIRVVDHGPGVPPERLETLFGAYQTTRKDGTGLGLFISRRIVESHHGSLVHEPTAGGGATFILRLPAAS